jgi:hypothetical protein
MEVECNRKQNGVLSKKTLHQHDPTPVSRDDWLTAKAVDILDHEKGR